MTGHAAAFRSDIETSRSPSRLFDMPVDIDVAWATAHPERALALLFVSPRPCAALDRLIGA